MRGLTDIILGLWPYDELYSWVIIEEEIGRILINFDSF